MSAGSDEIYWLVMPAAGIGQRFGTPLPKQYAALAGRTVIEHALAPFLADSRCRGIIVALASNDSHWSGILARLPGAQRARVRAVQGGAARAHSVRQGLAALEGHAMREDWVAVHDAARPCLDIALRDRVLETARRDASGALLAVPLADTIKRAGHAVRVESAADCVAEATVDRGDLWAAQTPQVFRYGELSAALDAAFASGRVPTDESQAMEWAGRRPRLVEGSPRNLKITSPLQLSIAEALLA